MLRLPRKRTTEISKMLRLPRQLQLVSCAKEHISSAPATQKMPRLPHRKFHACHGICTLAPLDAALTLRFAKTRNATRLKCCACLPRKTTMGTSKVLRQLRKLQRIFCKRRKSMAPTTQNDFHTLQNSSECHDVPRLPRETKPRDD